MKTEKLHLVGVLAAYVYLIVASIVLWQVWGEESKLYYWFVVMLAPVVLWLWCVVSWCGAQIFANAKRA
ncbi:LAQU0S12e03642g1_1 [Lachancea quebecensis]|uniref:LAQU0S12e03642g1_1 n=1 Tax=Lachancea quebecensis TaxID=1654605 RepID=A0A0P1KUL9_9SACH|nr:LAQU0S12e03642g1_1 [Lachancea quebecensis]